MVEIVVFDLEGVLIDNRKRLQYALRKVGAKAIEDITGAKRRLFWQIFLNRKLAWELDKVNFYGLQLLAQKSKRFFIAIVSGAPKIIVLDHIKKIKEEANRKGLPIRLDRIYYRVKSRLKASEFKRRVFSELSAEGKIVEVHDDDPSILDVAKKFGAKCYLWINLRPEPY